MSDGLVMRANVVLPERGGSFPSSLTATGYNKDVGNPTGDRCGTRRRARSVDRPCSTRATP